MVALELQHKTMRDVVARMTALQVPASQSISPLPFPLHAGLVNIAAAASNDPTLYPLSPKRPNCSHPPPLSLSLSLWDDTCRQDVEPEAAAAAAAATAATALQAGLPFPGNPGVVEDPGADPEKMAQLGEMASLPYGAALNSMRSTMPSQQGGATGAGSAPTPSAGFPYELQISQLLQENMLIIGRIRTNITSVMLADNMYVRSS